MKADELTLTVGIGRLGLVVTIFTPVNISHLRVGLCAASYYTCCIISHYTCCPLVILLENTRLVSIVMLMTLNYISQQTR